MIDYPHRVRLVRVETSGEDAWGRPAATGTTVLATVPAWCQPKSAREVAQLAAGAIRGDWTIFCPPSTFTEHDTLQQIDADDNVLRTFDVVGVRDPGGIGDHWEVDAVAVTHGPEV